MSKDGQVKELQAEVERLRDTNSRLRSLEARNQGEINDLEVRAITVERLQYRVNAQNSEIKSLVDRLQESEDERGTLRQERDQLKTEIAHMQIEVNNLRGLKPEIPPMPGEDWPRELPRYILRENGSHRPRSVPHKDGYWTPWYLANRLHEELERERKAAKTACANWGEMKQERDQLAVEVAALKPYRDNHHDLIRHIAAHDAEVIEQLKNKLLEFAKKSHRHRGPGIEFAVDLMDDRIDQLRRQAKEQNHES